MKGHGEVLSSGSVKSESSRFRHPEGETRRESQDGEQPEKTKKHAFTPSHPSNPESALNHPYRLWATAKRTRATSVAIPRMTKAAICPSMNTVKLEDADAMFRSRSKVSAQVLARLEQSECLRMIPLEKVLERGINFIHRMETAIGVNAYRLSGTFVASYTFNILFTVLVGVCPEDLTLDMESRSTFTGLPTRTERAQRYVPATGVLLESMLRTV